MVARALARDLRARGQEVRVVHRAGGPLDLAGAEEAWIDASRADDVEDATEGAACVYHCARPGPLEWPPALLWLARGVVEGTRRNGVHLVVLDDLSAYGRSSTIGPGSATRPCSPGGDLRARAAAIFLAPEARGNRRVAVARAADLFGPGATTAPLLGERFLRCVLAGRGAPAYGDPDLPHSYAYLPDVVRALVALGASPVAEGIHLLPVEPAESTARVFGRFYGALGIEPALSRRSAWRVWLREFLHPGSEEIAERLFQWRQPLVVDDARIRRELGVGTTPWDVAVRETLAWARGAFGPSVRPGRRPAGMVARAKGARSCHQDG
jgi:nucleoside-diphosphate-sugar epimerase